MKKYEIDRSGDEKLYKDLETKINGYENCAHLPWPAGFGRAVQPGAGTRPGAARRPERYPFSRAGLAPGLGRGSFSSPNRAHL